MLNMWTGPSQIAGPNPAQKRLGRSRPTVIFLLLFWSGLDPNQTLGRVQHWPDPNPMLIICRTWTVAHVMHATKMVAENGGWRGSGSLKAGVSTVIKRLSWWFWWRFFEERWPESFTGSKGRLLQKWERRRNNGCFKRGGDRLVVGLANYGGAGGGEAGGGWNGGEREGEKKLQKLG
jgi:hypothetical protein